MLPINVVLIGAFYLALIIVNGDANGTLARVAAFVPPLAPMVVPARMTLGDMNVVGLIAAVAVDLIATAGLIVLAGGIYERAILRMGAPIQLHRLLGSGRMRAKHARMAPASLDDDQARRARVTDAAGRMVAVVALLAGVVIGLDHATATVLLAFGLLLVVVLETRKHRRHKRAH
jgi:hypothetical protein